MTLEQISATQIQATQIGITHWLAVGAGAVLGAWLRWDLGIAQKKQNRVYLYFAAGYINRQLEWRFAYWYGNGIFYRRF